MAHVGTTNSLDRPAATGSGKQAGLWMALITGAAILAIAAAFAMTQLLGSTPVSVPKTIPIDPFDRSAGSGVVSSTPQAQVFYLPGGARLTTNEPVDPFDRSAGSGVVSSTPGDQVWYLPGGARVTASTIGDQMWYVPGGARVTADGTSGAGDASANADRNRHHPKQLPARRTHR